MILPALSAGLTSDNPAVTLGSPLVSPGTAGWPIGASAGMPASQAGAWFQLALLTISRCEQY
jgi:hypothetical protein